MHERNYYLAFSLAKGIGPKTFALLLKHFKTAQNTWNADSTDLKDAGLGEKTLANFEKAREGIDIKAYLEKLKQKKASFIAICDREYPKLLAQIPNPPIVLYYKGDLHSVFRPQTTVDSSPNAQSPFIAIVGTRKMTNYGREITKLFSFDLATAGLTIVSGLAMGVDAAAAESAIEAGGKTVAVMGNGVDLCFPSSNENLYDKILNKNGMIVSEFPLGMSPSVGSFPSRNRIIAGLSLGVLVTEGAEDSGSLITADYAFKFGRKVFAIPGPITSSLSKAPLKLISKGAKLVLSAEDIMSELNVSRISGVSKVSKGKKMTGLSKEELKVLQILENESLHFDEIVRKLKLDPSKAGTTLSMMEIKGLVKSLGGGNFSISS